MVLYLDDGWGIAPSFEECSKISNMVKSDLIKAGLVPNMDKSVWKPVQCIDWLGITWNSELGSIKVISRRVSSVKSCIEDITNYLPQCTARKLARFVGKIISLKPVVGFLVQLKTKYSSMMICEKSVHWDKKFYIPASSLVIEELFFWYNNIVKFNNKFVFSYSIPSILIYSDASHSGCGAVTVDEGMKFNYSWSASEAEKSSTWRELKAVALAIQSFGSTLFGKCVKLFTDNQGVPSVIQKGSMKADLQQLSIEIFDMCGRHNIDLHVQWIPRDLNQVADNLSREVDCDDWGISVDYFQYLDNLWGPHTVDRFADNYNTKTVRFNSKYCCVNSECVDAFSVSWADENNWLVPPVGVIVQVVKHIRASRAIGTLVIPNWPSSAFWPVIFSRNSQF